MSDTVIRFSRYALRLRAAFPGGSATDRHGVVIAMSDGEGHAGFGECAPLPGWHRESVDEAERALAELSRAAPWSELRTLTEVRRALSGTAAGTLPSVVFGVEMAWLGLEARRRRVVPARVLCSDGAERVLIAALFAGNVEDARGFATAAATVKVKVGLGSLDDDIAVVQTLIERLDRGVSLRLDGNRAFTLEQSLTLVRAVGAERLEYFEEPLRAPAELRQLHDATGVALALDETRREPANRMLWNAPGVTTWILKPALHGAFFETRQTADRARDAGIRCVVSSCFESGLGLWALAQLAACVQPAGVAAGLGTGRWLFEDLIEPPFENEAGSVAIADWVGTPR